MKISQKLVGSLVAIAAVLKTRYVSLFSTTMQDVL